MAGADRLRLGARIARGGMAEVFAARLMGPAGFEKDVAVKRVLPRYADDPVFLQRFLSEARLAARLSHPNIVQIFELGNDGHNHYIVMEAVRGATLRQVLQRLDEAGERMPPALALCIARSICMGLTHAHEHAGPDGRSLGIIHRDISPQNVLLGHEGAVKIIDFGIARAHASEHLTAVGHRMGKPHYMAPEQIASQAVDARVDLFAVGVLLHEMLTGERPFTGSSDLEVIDRIRRGARRPVRELAPEVPESCVGLLDRALAVRRDDRFPSARSFAAALAEVSAGIGLQADAQDIEALLTRLLPDDARRPWPVDDESAGGDNGHAATASVSFPDENTEPLDGPPSTVAGVTNAIRSSLRLKRIPPQQIHGPWPKDDLSGGSASADTSTVFVTFRDESTQTLDAPNASIHGERVVIRPSPPVAQPTGWSWLTTRRPSIGVGVLLLGAVAGVLGFMTWSPTGPGSTPGRPAETPAMPVESPSSIVFELPRQGLMDLPPPPIETVESARPETTDVPAGGAEPPRERHRPPRETTAIGRLVVETRPWSEVQLDGRHLGMTPLSVQVRIGRHRLVLENREQSLRREFFIVVDQKTPTVVRADLRLPP